jgi:hypothetical protein
MLVHETYLEEVGECHNARTGKPVGVGLLRHDCLQEICRHGHITVPFSIYAGLIGKSPRCGEFEAAARCSSIRDKRSRMRGVEFWFGSEETAAEGVLKMIAIR